LNNDKKLSDNNSGVIARHNKSSKCSLALFYSPMNSTGAAGCQLVLVKTPNAMKAISLTKMADFQQMIKSYITAELMPN